MAFRALLLFLFAILSICQDMTPMCATVSQTSPMCTLTFTPPMPTQLAPTSTVYGAIMTSHLNVVDCKYCMVQNVDANPMKYGRFTTKTTIPVLTIWRVGCMPETTAITRRDFRGYDMAADSIHPRTVEVIEHQKLHKRALSTETILDIAQEAQDILPNRDGFSVEAYRYFMQINTARFAINLINSGLPLDVLCTELRNATIAQRLTDASLFPKQAGDIVCYASVYGIFFNMSNQDLLSDLDTLEYALQINAGFTTNLEILCETMDLSTADELGIDAAGIRNLVCTRASSTAAVVSSQPTSPVNTTASPLYPNSTTVAPMITASNSTTQVLATSAPPFTNSTAGANMFTIVNSSIEATSTFPSSFGGSGVLGTVGTAWPKGPSGIGGPGPFINATGSWTPATGVTAQGTGVVTISSIGTIGTIGSIGSVGTGTPGSSVNASGLVPHLPPIPSVSLYYPVWTTSTTVAQLPRY